MVKGIGNPKPAYRIPGIAAPGSRLSMHTLPVSGRLPPAALSAPRRPAFRSVPLRLPPFRHGPLRRPRSPGPAAARSPLPSGPPPTPKPWPPPWTGSWRMCMPRIRSGQSHLAQTWLKMHAHITFTAGTSQVPRQLSMCMNFILFDTHAKRYHSNSTVPIRAAGRPVRIC